MDCTRELELLEKILVKLENCLREAYYSTPPHIASKTLVYRALVLTRNTISYIESVLGEK